MIPTYGGVLSAIKKALQELVEEYRGVREIFPGLGKGPEEEHGLIGENWSHNGAEMGFGRSGWEGGERKRCGGVRGWPWGKLGGGDSVVHLLLVFWFCFLIDFYFIIFYEINV